MDTQAQPLGRGAGDAADPPSPDVGSRLADADLSRWVTAARGGDERAFREVYRSVQPRLLRYLRALVGDDAEDVASEVWLQIVRDLAAFRGGGDDFRGWSATIAHNRAIDHLRARSRRPRMVMAIDDLDDRPGAIDTATSALDAVATRLAMALIVTLPHDQAEAVLLRVVVGLDTDGTARVLGKRAGAVRTSTYRGLRRLAGILDQRRKSRGDPGPPPRRRSDGEL